MPAAAFLVVCVENVKPVIAELCVVETAGTPSGTPAFAATCLPLRRENSSGEPAVEVAAGLVCCADFVTNWNEFPVVGRPKLPAVVPAAGVWVRPNAPVAPGSLSVLPAPELLLEVTWADCGGFDGWPTDADAAFGCGSLSPDVADGTAVVAAAAAACGGADGGCPNGKGRPDDVGVAVVSNGLCPKGEPVITVDAVVAVCVGEPANRNLNHMNKVMEVVCQVGNIQLKVNIQQYYLDNEYEIF